MAKNDHRGADRRRIQAEQERFLARGGSVQRVEFGKVRGNIYEGPRRHDYLFARGKPR